MTIERATEQGLAYADEVWRLRTSPDFEMFVMKALHDPDAVEKLARDRLITIGLEGTKEEIRAFAIAAFKKLQGTLFEHVKTTYFPQAERTV